MEKYVIIITSVRYKNEPQRH